MTGEDYEAVQRLYEEPGMLAYMPSFFPAEEPEGYFESYIKNMYRFYDFGMYVLVDMQTGKIIGHAGLGVEEGTDGCGQEAEGAEARITLGYAISAPYRRKGLAALACREILLYARDSLYLDRVWIRIDERNLASLAVAQQLRQQFGAFVAVEII